MATIREFFQNLLYQVPAIGITDIVDILVVSIIFYSLLRLIRSTSAARVARAILLLLAITLLTDVLNLRKYATQTDAVVFLPRDESLRSNRMFPYKLVALEVEDFGFPITGGWVHHATHEMNAAERCVVEALDNICQQYVEAMETE